MRPVGVGLLLGCLYLGRFGLLGRCLRGFLARLVGVSLLLGRLYLGRLGFLGRCLRSFLARFLGCSFFLGRFGIGCSLSIRRGFCSLLPRLVGRRLPLRSCLRRGTLRRFRLSRLLRFGPLPRIGGRPLSSPGLLAPLATRQVPLSWRGPLAPPAARDVD